jgi:single-strand DNA-binding protein
MSGFDINQLTISGNLTADPELRYLASGTALTKVRIAHNERRKLDSGEWIDNPQFFDVTIWGAIGKWIAEHVAKGDKVVVAGRLRWREWDTDAGKRQAVDITADSIVPAPRDATNGRSDTDENDADDIAF